MKRAFDVAAALALLTLLAPVVLGAFLLIRLTSGGPAVFRQPRIGRNGRTFTMFKFRTMHVDAERRLNALLAANVAARDQWEAQFKLDPDPRIIPFGLFLRRSGIDELPQLFNVLNGSMSIVGPRPPLLAERDRYGSALEQVLSVRPGITGPWQVSGDVGLEYERRIQYGLRYVEERSWSIDARIIWLTVLQQWSRLVSRPA